MAAQPAPAGQDLAINKNFVLGGASGSFQLSAPDAQELAEVIAFNKPIPPGQFELASIHASLKGGTKLALGDPTRSVQFSGSASGFFELGIYCDATQLISSLGLSPQLGIQIPVSAQNRAIGIAAGYNLSGSAKGAMALGAGVSLTFGVSASTSGAFAVVHHIQEDQKALSAFGDTFASWALPWQVGKPDGAVAPWLPKPGTWLIAEVDGSFAMNIGAHAGYSFSWLRQFTDGILRGDLGVKVQLAASATLGFSASGQYSLVIARESEAEKLRLQLFKSAKKGWQFALDAAADVQGQIPPGLQGKSATELISAIFGVHATQLIADIKEARNWIDDPTSMQDKLANFLVDLGQKKLGQAGFPVQQWYEEGLAQARKFLDQTNNLGHEITSTLLTLVDQKQLAELQSVLLEIQQVANDPASIQDILAKELSSTSFGSSPIGRILFTEFPSGLLAPLSDNASLQKIGGLATQILEVLNGDTLQHFVDFTKKKVGLDAIEKVVDEASFAQADNWLKARVAAFLNQTGINFKEVDDVRQAVQHMLQKADDFWAAALKAARKDYQFRFTASYQASSERTALFDIDFDMTLPEAVEAFRSAIDGDFRKLLLEEVDGVSLRTAQLTHDINRQFHSELNMPFLDIKSGAVSDSMAKLTIQQEGGRVLVYQLDATGTESQMKATSARDSTLAISAAIKVDPASKVRKFSDDRFLLSYKLQRAVLDMRTSQLQQELAPLVDDLLGDAFEGAGVPSFNEWIIDLDKVTDSDPQAGTGDVGDTGYSIEIAYPGELLKAWLDAPGNKNDPIYFEMSRRLQDKVKQLLFFYYFHDPNEYATPGTAAAPLVWSCIPALTNSGTFWNWPSVDVRNSVVNSIATTQALTLKMSHIQAMLQGIPKLKNIADIYRPVPNKVQEMKNFALNSPLLTGLLRFESGMIDGAINAGVQMAKFQQESSNDPAAALKQLSSFGSTITRLFGSNFGEKLFFGNARGAAASMLMAEAAQAIHADSRPAIAMLTLIVAKSSARADVASLLNGTLTGDKILTQQHIVNGQALKTALAAGSSGL